MNILIALSSAVLAAPPAAGDLVITELMAAPACQYNEWFEALNVSGATLDLDGCVLEVENPSSGSVTDHSVEGSAELAPGEYGVLFRSTSSCGDAVNVDEAGMVNAIYKYGSLSYSNSDPRILRVSCGGVMVDEIRFDNSAFNCNDETYAACSLQLDPSSTISADSNDDASAPGGAWCESNAADTYTDNSPTSEGGPYTVLGTPGAANQCGDGGGDPSGSGSDSGSGSGSGDDGDDGPVVVPPDVCVPGDLVISELMIAPRDGANADEWIEVYGSGSGCNLHSCVIQTWTDEEGLRDEDQIKAGDDSLQLAPGDFAVLARSTSADRDAGGIVWTDSAGDDTAAAYLYDYGVYLRSDPGEVRLVCNDQLVDSARMDWGAFSDLIGGCPDGWCSVNLHPEFMSPEANDDLANWCVPPADENLHTHTDPNGDLWQLVGTPGKENDCPFFDWPVTGEAAFVEIMTAPQGTNEWFELHNATDRDLELTLCELRREKSGYDEESGEYGVLSEQSWLIGEDGVEVMVAAGSVQLFVKDDCLSPDVTSEDTGFSSASCSYDEVFYGSLSFTADSDEALTLVCPDATGGTVVVDRIEFNMAVQGVRDGHSLMLDQSKYGPDAHTINDSPDAWCEAAFSQEFYKADEEDCNFGTPGEASDCLTDPLNPPDTVCRCSSTSWKGMWLAWLMPLAVLWRRRD
ncbi:MAG: hypothetical protein CL927_06060 [Deltaproteobacteria bacterium]|nr:hypothetical protein [Deltaproteobacteria bacterium]